MILVLSGTKEAGEIVKALSQRRISVLATATTEYGGMLAREKGALETVVGALDAHNLQSIILNRRVETVIDATHPYAVKVTSMAQQVCQELGIKYIRFARSPLKVEDNEQVFWSDSFGDAADKSFQLGNVVLSTVGTKHLETLINRKPPGKRLVVRVLPDIKPIQTCRALGISPVDIIAAQGPFTVEMNKAVYRQYGVQVVVTKESGSTGGTDTKIKAAMELDLAVVIVSRPRETIAVTVDTVDRLLNLLGVD